MDHRPSFESIAIITTTVGEEADANRLAQAAVQAGLAACVQTESMSSHYIWQGQLECSGEWRLVLKTVPAVVPDLLEWLQAQHPYDVPQLLVRTEQANPAYAAWVAAQVKIKK